MSPLLGQEGDYQTLVLYKLGQSSQRANKYQVKIISSGSHQRLTMLCDFIQNRANLC